MTSYMIKNKNNEYVTRKNMHSDLSLTSNINFAYTYELKDEAEAVKRYLEEHEGFEELEVVEWVSNRNKR